MRQPTSMDTIIVKDLEVFCRVGVSEEERAQAQRLLITAEMARDFLAAAENDDLAATIDYHAVTERLLRFGKEWDWRLIETLAEDIARVLLDEFKADSVSVEVKKFAIPQARYVSVRIKRGAAVEVPDAIAPSKEGGDAP